MWRWHDLGTWVLWPLMTWHRLILHVNLFHPEITEITAWHVHWFENLQGCASLASCGPNSCGPSHLPMSSWQGDLEIARNYNSDQRRYAYVTVQQSLGHILVPVLLFLFHYSPSFYSHKPQPNKSLKQHKIWTQHQSSVLTQPFETYYDLNSYGLISFHYPQMAVVCRCQDIP